MLMKITTGSAFFDRFLAGGYDADVVTTLYGPSGSGKTNLCLLAAVAAAVEGKQVLFMDTEGGIAVERIMQINPDVNTILPRIFFYHPMTFAEQREMFERLRDVITPSVGLIVIDSISMLYRLELGKSEEVYEVNSALGKQIALLVEIARRKQIPVLITTQVYSDFDNRDKVKMVGGDLLRYGSKCLLEVQKLASCRSLILRKHRALPEGKEILFKIVEKGVEEVTQ